jgi:hypothetical protein
MLLFSWPNYLILYVIFWVEQALLKNATEAMKESRVTEILSTVGFFSTSIRFCTSQRGHVVLYSSWLTVSGFGFEICSQEFVCNAGL